MIIFYLFFLKKKYRGSIKFFMFGENCTFSISNCSFFAMKNLKIDFLSLNSLKNSSILTISGNSNFLIEVLIINIYCKINIFFGEKELFHTK